MITLYTSIVRGGLTNYNAESDFLTSGMQIIRYCCVSAVAIDASIGATTGGNISSTDGFTDFIIEAISIHLLWEFTPR